MEHLNNGRKRGSPDSARTFYPRKRALVACEVCRRKKTKCDNERPTCSGCRELGIECVYRDQRPDPDHSTYDLASLEILDRLSHVSKLVEAQNVHLSGLLPTLLAGQHHTAIQPSPSSHDFPSDGGSAAPFFSTPQTFSHVEDFAKRWPDPSDEAALLSESLDFAETNTGTCEGLLEWPIFEGRFHRSETETLIFDPDQAQDSCTQQDSKSSIESDHSGRRSGYGRGVREEDMLKFIDKFLVNVHIKNPILEADDIRRMAKNVMEHGLRWDAPSCLVLIASALGCLSSPWTSEYIVPDQQPSNSIEDANDYPTAEDYYVAAQKRVGLLKTSIIASQCCFLTGVYEMYSLRPLRAWSSFNRACVTLQTYLMAKARSVGPASERLERRLYWSCLKSECEMRMEVCLPPSGLAKINYPDVLPTPPGGSPGRRPDGLFHEPNSSMLTAEQEQSWCYYLSDIAVRRIANRTINSLYLEDESSWMSTPVERLIRVAEELELQLTQWRDSVPKLMATPDPSTPQSDTGELQLLVQGRFTDLRPHIYRPFLYLAVHQPASWAGHRTIEPYVERCVSTCIEATLLGCLRHRHHGTWYQNRATFGKALQILAAVKCGRVRVPPSWRSAIESTIAGLAFWEGEAPDLRRARTILQSILDDIDG